MSEELDLKERKLPKSIVDKLIDILTELGYKIQILEDEEELYVIWKSNEGHYYFASYYSPKFDFFDTTFSTNFRIGYLFMDYMFFDFSIVPPVNKREIISVINKMNKLINKKYNTEEITKFLSNSDTCFQMWKQRCFIEKVSREANDLVEMLKLHGYKPEIIETDYEVFVAWKTNIGLYVITDVYFFVLKKFQKIENMSLGYLTKGNNTAYLGFYEGLKYPVEIDNIIHYCNLLNEYYLRDIKENSKGMFCISEQDYAYNMWKKDMLKK